MGMDSSGPRVDRQAVYVALTSALQEVRGGVHAPDMARMLLRHGSGSTSLLGIRDDGELAFFHDTRTTAVSAIPFDRHGLRPRERDQRREEVPDPADWIATTAEEFAWVHPTYRGRPC